MFVQGLESNNQEAPGCSDQELLKGHQMVLAPDNQLNNTTPSQDTPSGSAAVPLMFNTVALLPGLEGSSGVKTVSKIVGFRKLSQFLAPKHPYFADKQGHIEKFGSYRRKCEAEDEQADLFLYPIVKGDDERATKLNAYRKYRLARSHTGRTIAELEGCIKKNNLPDARMAELIMTYPDDTSKALSERKDFGRGLAWDCYKKCLDGLPGILGFDGTLGYTDNLHTWKTENPLLPHYHFHTLLMNYYVEQFIPAYTKTEQLEMSKGLDCMVDFKKWFGEGILKTRTSEADGVQRGYFPFSSDELKLIKQFWTDIVRKMCKRYKLPCAYLDEDAGNTLDVGVSFFSMDDRTKLANRLNYQRRSWIEDYALYTLKEPACENPPAWLEGYSNKARVFGWWQALTLLGGIASKEKTPKLDYETGEELVACGYCTSLVGMNLWSRENVKGNVVDAPLRADDLAWLRSVYWSGFDGGG